MYLKSRFHICEKPCNVLGFFLSFLLLSLVPASYFLLGLLLSVSRYSSTFMIGVYVWGGVRACVCVCVCMCLHLDSIYKNHVICLLNLSHFKSRDCFKFYQFSCK